MIGPVNAGLQALAALRWRQRRRVRYADALRGWRALLGTLAAGALRIGGRMGLMLPAFTGLIGLLALIGLGRCAERAGCLRHVRGDWLWHQLRQYSYSLVAPACRRRLLGRVMSVVVAAALGLDPFSRAVAGLAIDWSTSAMFAVAGAGILAIRCWPPARARCAQLAERALVAEQPGHAAAPAIARGRPVDQRPALGAEALDDPTSIAGSASIPHGAARPPARDSPVGPAALAYTAARMAAGVRCSNATTRATPQALQRRVDELVGTDRHDRHWQRVPQRREHG